MKNSEFVKMLQTLGKIEYTYDNINDDSVFELDKYYKKYKHKLEGIDKNSLDAFVSTMLKLANKNYTKDIEQRFDMFLEFILDVFVDNFGYTEQLINIGSFVPIPSVMFCNMGYDFTMSRKFNINGKEYYLIRDKEIRAGIEYNCWILKRVKYDYKDKKVYRDVICIEKDLDTNEVKVVTRNYDPKINQKALSRENNKFKIIFEH